jgi:hypothetical protein
MTRGMNMKRFHIGCRSVWIFCLLLIAASVFAEVPPGNGEYEPQPYQAGKDVVWVPTELVLTEKMLEMAKVTPRDYLIDLGSGDGRIVITAAQRGARAMGIEYNGDLIALSKQNAMKAGVSDKVQFVQADLFESDFSQATVLTMFLLPEINLKLRPKILDLTPGTRVVSNSFDMKEWAADRTVEVKPEEGCMKIFCKAYLWIVPAKVEGLWEFPQGKLMLVQRFQRIFGELQSGNKLLPVTNGRLQGDQIRFTIGSQHFSGRINGDTMQGSVKAAGKTHNWVANRTDSPF